MEIFKKIHINIPFSEALEQIPWHVKFLKDILVKKRKVGDYEIVSLYEEVTPRPKRVYGMCNRMCTKGFLN